MLFAIDDNTEEIIISDSLNGSKRVNFIERIKKKDNQILYSAVLTLRSISRDAKIDKLIFTSMDNVCQMIYNNSKKI